MDRIQERVPFVGATGTHNVQLIGGEPTLYPDALAIAEHALAAGVAVEAYSNLAHIFLAWQEILRKSGMSLSTSYYSADPAQRHDRPSWPTSGPGR